MLYGTIRSKFSIKIYVKHRRTFLDSRKLLKLLECCTGHVVYDNLSELEIN